MSTSTKRCYYETLEVERDADESKLKSSFRKLAMKFHPDRNPGDETSEVKFKEINEAYEVLKDKDKRAAYDRYGHAAFEQGGGFGGGGAGFGAGFVTFFLGSTTLMGVVPVTFSSRRFLSGSILLISDIMWLAK